MILRQFFCKFNISILLISASLQVIAASETPAKEVLIQKDFKSINVIHHSVPIDIERNQDRKNNIIEFYQGTWRGKIQPLHPFKPHPVETVAELEMIDYIDQMSHGNDSIMIVDSRPKSAILITGIIPGATQVGYIDIVSNNYRVKTFELFNVKKNNSQWDFTDAKTLVIYCNGLWCGKSPKMIRKLIKLGYPAQKIKYYRGGMQAWKSVGLTTVKE